jgi:hypothetical protein
VQVDGGVSELGMTEEHLDGAQVGACFQHVCREAMPTGIVVLLMIRTPQPSAIVATLCMASK